MSHDPYEHLDAVYLLDALSPEERAEYEAHLEGCADCRSRLEDISSVLPYLAGSTEDVLDEQTEARAPAPPLPDTVLPALLDAVGRARRRRRALMGAVSGLAAACIAALVFVTISVTGDDTPAGRQMAALRPSLVNAEVALQPTAWGTQIEVTCWYRPDAQVPTGYRYGLTVRSTSGETFELGTWQLSPGQRITFTAGTALDAAEIDHIDITDPGGTPLLELAN